MLSVNLCRKLLLLICITIGKEDYFMPLPKGNNKTDKTRKYQNEFDKANYKVAACKISIAKYECFQAIAASQGKTVSGLLSEYIDNCIAGSDRGQESKPE